MEIESVNKEENTIPQELSKSDIRALQQVLAKIGKISREQHSKRGITKKIVSREERVAKRKAQRTARKKTIRQIKKCKKNLIKN